MGRRFRKKSSTIPFNYTISDVSHDYVAKRLFLLKHLFTKVVRKMNAKDKAKMLEIIKNKQSGGRSKQMSPPKNDQKNMRKGPKIYNK